jgi:hypothetical protein
MRNRILNASFVLGLGLLTVAGCGGSSDDQGGGVSDDGKGGATGKGGTTGNGGSGGTLPPLGGATGKGGSTGSGGATGNGGSGGACIEGSLTGAKTTVALYFMVDISGSMSCPVPEEDPPCTGFSGTPGPVTRWTGASQAYKDFFSSSAAAGLWAGIAFFSGDSCNVGNYGVDVEIGELPANATELNAAVDDQTPSGNTPTVPSLTAAIDHARQWAGSHTDQQVVVVYATDGYPRGCNDNNTIDDAVDVAAAGLTGSPSILTYVLAIGPNLTDLGRVATAGGTTAIAIDTSNDVGAELIAALNDIREEVVVDCAYTIPPAPAGQTINYNTINVRITTSDGEEITVGRDDPNASGCNGWEFNDPVARSQIILCGDACDTVQGDPNARFDVVLSCDDRPIIEPP